MKKWTVIREGTVSEFYTVEAESEQEAIDKVQGGVLTPDWVKDYGMDYYASEK